MDMETTVAIPKFRTARRLVQWMERNWHRLKDHRVPPDRERVFLDTKKETPESVAPLIARYSGWAGKVDAEYESVLRRNKDCVFQYARNLRHKGLEVDQSLVDELAGDSKNLYRLAKEIGRLPKHLEDTISEPRFAFMYAKEVLFGRLPRHLEDVFFKDAYYAAKYAFEIIRGFSPVRLPDELHTFMVMKSFEDPGNEHIRAYIEASESDPSKIGNTVNKVR